MVCPVLATSGGRGVHTRIIVSTPPRVPKGNRYELGQSRCCQSGRSAMPRPIFRTGMCFFWQGVNHSTTNLNARLPACLPACLPFFVLFSIHVTGTTTRENTKVAIIACLYNKKKTQALSLFAHTCMCCVLYSHRTVLSMYPTTSAHPESLRFKLCGHMRLEYEVKHSDRMSQ